jgi:hypothetical protein
MTTVQLKLTVHVAWWIKLLRPVWFVQHALGYRLWIPRRAIRVESAS